MEEKYSVTVRGISPLLSNRMDIEPIKKKKKAGEGYDNQGDAEKALYKDDGVICQPSIHFEAAMVKAASNYKIPGAGKKTYKDAFKGGIIINPLMIPHKIPIWKLDLQSVVVGRARIIRARPRFDSWELDFEITNIDERILQDVIKDCLVDAGKFVGIGDYRPKFGRFEVIKFEKIR